MKYTDSDIKRLDKMHNIHPFMNFKAERHVIERGEGAYVYEMGGRRILDGIAGLWCVNLGYGRKELAEVMAEQAMRLPYYSSFVAFTNVPSTLLSEKVCSLAPSNLKHAYFTLGGSEANDATVRIIDHYNHLRKKPKKRHIISRKNAYHGMTYMAASISGITSNNENYNVVSEYIHHISTPNNYRKPEKGMTDEQYVEYLCKEFEEKITQLGAGNVSAFFAEPIMGAGGLFVAPEGYHKKMWEICKKYDVLYVSDEVVSAFCRLGEFFASEKVYGIKPDIINCAKGITSGYIPLAATLISDDIYKVISEGEFTTGYTYSGHPVATAVALKNIEIMEREKTGEHVKQITPYLYEQLETLKKYKFLGDVRGRNFMIGLEVVRNRDTKESFPTGTKASNRIIEECFKLGLIVRPLGESTIVISPPLIWEKSHIDELVSILDKSFKKVADELTKEKLI